MNDRTDETVPETPNAKRLSIPSFDIDPDEPLPVSFQKLANAMLQIGENLQYLRLEAERRHHQETANEIAIRQHDAEIKEIKGELTAHDARLDDLEGRVSILEGRAEQT